MCGSMADETKFGRKANVAVIGVGNMGKHHARVYSGLDEANLVAVCDTELEKAEEIAKRFGCGAYADYQKMLENENIDAVSVAVPTKFHSEVALHCIKRGVHVLIEKPLADSIENAQAIIDAASEKNVILMAGHIERFNPAVQKLKAMIDSGELGAITSVIARRVGVFPPQIRDANVIIDLAIHDIDIFNYLLGKEPVKVNVNSGRALINQRDDFADMLLDYGGTNAFVQVNWITPVKIRGLAVTGTKGYAELNYITQELVVHKSRFRNIDDFNDVVEFGTPEKCVIRVEKAEPLRLELAHFIGCVTSGKQPLVTGRDALSALRVALNAIETSGDENV